MAPLAPVNAAAAAATAAAVEPIQKDDTFLKILPPYVQKRLSIRRVVFVLDWEVVFRYDKEKEGIP